MLEIKTKHLPSRRFSITDFDRWLDWRYFEYSWITDPKAPWNRSWWGWKVEDTVPIQTVTLPGWIYDRFFEIWPKFPKDGVYRGCINYRFVRRVPVEV